MEKKNWILRELKIEMVTYGENKGKYEGKISFQNEESESFSFKVKPEMAEQCLKILSTDINNFASGFVNSLGKND